MNYIIVYIILIIILISYYCRDSFIEADENQNNILSNMGYRIYRNVLDKNKVMEFRDTVTDTLDYGEGKEYIYKNIIPVLKNAFSDEVRCTKFRISNNNNSTDAASFHRDINSHSYNNGEIPVYTALNSLDGGVMEVIPGSHKKQKFNILESFSRLNDKRYIKLNPTDLLIFNSNLLHRGNFTIKQPNRRLIQIFEIFPNKEIYDLYNKKIQTLTFSLKNASYIPYMVKIPVLNKFVGLYEYLRMSTQRWSIKGSNEEKWDSDDFYSSHEHTDQTIPVKGIRNKTNLYAYF